MRSARMPARATRRTADGGSRRGSRAMRSASPYRPRPAPHRSGTPPARHRAGRKAEHPTSAPGMTRCRTTISIPQRRRCRARHPVPNPNATSRTPCAARAATTAPTPASKRARNARSRRPMQRRRRRRPRPRPREAVKPHDQVAVQDLERQTETRRAADRRPRGSTTAVDAPMTGWPSGRRLQHGGSVELAPAAGHGMRAAA